MRPYAPISPTTMLRYFHQYQSVTSSNKLPTVLDGSAQESMRVTTPSNISQNNIMLTSNNRSHNSDVNSFPSNPKMYNVSILS